jgi:hypothetical protein
MAVGFSPEGVRPEMPPKSPKMNTTRASHALRGPLDVHGMTISGGFGLVFRGFGQIDPARPDPKLELESARGGDEDQGWGRLGQRIASKRPEMVNS